MMKKITNKYCILFIFSLFFVVFGISGRCLFHLFKSTCSMISGFSHGIIYSSILDFKSNVDDISNQKLNYHDTMMDIDSIKNNLLGTRVVIKKDTTVVKSDSGSLMEPTRRIEDSEIAEVIPCIQELKTVAEENGSKFLYCAVPMKGLYEKAPDNIDNYFEDNYDRLLLGLDAARIPTLDLSIMLERNYASKTDIFYYTDHHWKTYSGFLASNAICEELSALYGFDYNEQYADIHNYNITNYSDWFLGSKGKKVGTFFTWHGADDFELITPAFETNMTEIQPFKNQIREGSFEDTVLFLQNIEKDFYNINTYTTSSGGDFRLQIMNNNLNPEGKKLLLVRDSFACVVAPFLSLQTSELHICDMRNLEWFVGEKLNLRHYIKEINPDYVIVLYSGVYNINTGKYDFF